MVDFSYLRKPSKSHPYQMRITVDQGPKFTGKRVCFSLGTHDKMEAIKRRDCILDCLEKAEFVVKGSGSTGIERRKANAS